MPRRHEINCNRAQRPHAGARYWAWLSGKPRRVVFPCVPITTAGFLQRSIQSGDTLGSREIALDSVGQIGHCEAIQSVRVCPTATGACTRLIDRRQRMLSALVASVRGRIRDAWL